MISQRLRADCKLKPSRAAWKGFLDAFPEDSPTVVRMIAEGNIVFVEFRSGGTNSGPLALPTGDTLPPTGRRVELGGVSVSEVENGKVNRERFYWDCAAFAQQLGLIPEPATADGS